MKALNKLIFAILCSCALVACGGGNSNVVNDDFVYTFAEDDAPSNSMHKDGNNFVLEQTSSKLVLEKRSKGYAVKLYVGDILSSYNNSPAIIRVRGPETGLLSTFTEKEYSTAYETVEEKNYGYLCKATITSNAGSIFHIYDSYFLKHKGGIVVDRVVSISKAVSEDKGFSSVISLINGDDSTNADEFYYFIPSILYKTTSDMAYSAIASNLYVDRVYVKETRMGLPMAMICGTDTGLYYSLSDYKPQISAEGVIAGGANGEINQNIKYGSFGYTMSPISVDYTYPCAEGPTTYDSGSGWAKRYHPVVTSIDHHCSVCISTNKMDNFNDALVDSYKVSYEHVDSSVKQMSNTDLYNACISYYNGEYKEFGPCAGNPWQISITNPNETRKYSMQMGFVGQQTSIGYHLYRQGKLTNDTELVRRGTKIIDFWTSSTIQSSYFPIVWWDASNTASGGQKRNYECYLRCMVDGMEGILDAYNYAIKSNDTSHGVWLEKLIRFADNLIAKQGADGSFGRAYTLSGGVAYNPNDNRVQGDSKLNTPIAIRFLAKMYNTTKDDKYKEAALKAAEFAYENLYMDLGKYVGGTPDNPNVVDKEAAIYAMYGFRFAYELSNNTKYIKALEHAAVVSLSWTFIYNFACPAKNATLAAANPFEHDGRTIGFSVIATGHGGSDNFASYIWFDLYRTFEITNDDFYYDAAILIENGSKLNTDYDGSLGYLYRCMAPEASNISEFYFSSVGTCLPWCVAANANPISYFMDTYNVECIEDIK